MKKTLLSFAMLLSVALAQPQVAKAQTASLKWKVSVGVGLSSSESMNLGFAGKSCIHPSQIKIVHKIFTPNKEELEKSLEIVRAAKAADISKGGVITVNGKMVDIPVIAKAEKIVRLAKSAGMIK